MTENASAQDISKDARTWAMLCHLSALVGLLGNGIGFLLGPLVVWLVKKNDDSFIDEQGKEAVNFQITMLLAALVSAILIFVIIGIFLLIVVAIIATVLPIIGAIKASEGEHFKYPFALRLVK
jgi:uncharacterized Tic20 family protein